MTQTQQRRLLWTMGALGALVVAIATWMLPRTNDPFVVLIGATIVLLLLAVPGLTPSVRPSPTWDRAIHTAGTWRALSMLRVGAIVAFVAYASLVLLTILSETGETAGVSSLMAALPLGGALICGAGAILEGRGVPATRRVPVRELGRAPAKPLYRTRQGAVFARPSPQGRDLIVRSQGSTHRLGEIERSVDARHWNVGRKPSPDELRDALQRWGQLNEGV